jgi:hypothetical protein
MKKVICTVLIIAVWSLFLMGCAQRMVDFTIISTKNVNLSNPNGLKRSTERVQGKDMRLLILGIPMGTPEIKEAIDKTIEKTKNAVALLDGVVYYKAWNAILFGQYGYVVEGSPLLDTNN